jgi:hypothetical protein
VVVIAAVAADQLKRVGVAAFYGLQLMMRVG